MHTDNLITVYLPNGRISYMPLEDFNETEAVAGKVLQ